MAHTALDDRPNQYPPMFGLPELRQAVAKHNRRFYDLDIDWKTETLVTSGATEALAAAHFGLIEPGDEVVLIEPLYDCYLPIIRRAGAVPRLVRIEPPDWSLPEAELRAAFSGRTKLVLLNTPMNPAAKVFTRGELELIAGLCREHDAYCVADEVYEHLVFDGRPHITMMSLPGMRERTVRIGSAGKTFALTGWKVGYITAPPDLMTPIAKTHQFLTFTTPPNLQRASAYGLEKDESYFHRPRPRPAAQPRPFQGRPGRDRLRGHRLPRHLFHHGRFRPLGFNGDDVDFCRTLTAEAGVAAVPVSAFYQNDPPRHFARFSFCKEDATLDEALKRMRAYFGR